MRAATLRLRDGHAGADAVHPRRIRCGADNAPPAPPPADDHRQRRQVRAAGDLGGGEEGIEIGMQDGARPCCPRPPVPGLAWALWAAGRPHQESAGAGHERRARVSSLGFLLMHASRRSRVVSACNVVPERREHPEVKNKCSEYRERHGKSRCISLWRAVFFGVEDLFTEFHE